MRLRSGNVNRFRTLAFAAGIAALVLGCFSAFGSSEPDKMPSVASADVTVAEDAARDLGNPGPHLDLANWAVQHEGSAVDEMVDWRKPYPHDRPTDEYRDFVWSQIRVDPPEIRDHHDPDVGGDWAYRLYLHFWRCVRAAEQGSADRSLEVWAERAEEARGRELDAILDSAEHMADLVALCMGIPPETDRFLEAFTWLGEAARLNHEVAQINYYRVANSYLDHPLSGETTLLQRHPEVIVELKKTAQYSLEKALERGHPEAYLAMSQALSDGIVFEKDPFGAYAYAHTAELVAYENREFINQIGHQKYILASLLTTQEVEDAKQLAHELVAVN